MKKFLILATLLFVTSDAWAANRYARTVGGNWTDNATWSTTSGGAADTVAPTASDDVFLDANSGNVTISATSVGKSLTCTGYTGTLTHNTGITLTLSGSATFVSGMTYTPTATSVLSFNATATLTTGTKLMPLVNFTGTTLTIGDNLTFMDSKVITLTNSGSGSMNLNGFTVSGFSSTSRVLIRTGTLGTSRTITNTTGTFANADFRDITFSTNADYSAITGKSGDCGGNSNATFTTSADQHWISASGGNWSDVTKWTSRVPLPQDNVYFDNAFSASQTVTADMPRLGKSIDWTGASGTPTFSSSITGNGATMYGSLTMISAMVRSGWSGGLVFEGRGTHTITTAGLTMVTPTFQGVGGTYTLLDAANFGSGNTLTLSNGTLNTNGFAVSCGQYIISGTATRAANLGSSTLTASSTGTVWSLATTTGLTWNAGTSTIVFSDISASSKTFAGGGLTYNNLQITGGGAGAVIITGANTFNRIYTDGGGTKSITLPGSTTTTIISGDGLGNGTNLITFTASSGSATVAKSGGGRVGWDYVSLTNIPASTANTWYAGPSTHSTDGGGNTNWIFSDAPNDSILMFSYPFSSRRFNSNR